MADNSPQCSAIPAAKASASRPGQVVAAAQLGERLVEGCGDVVGPTVDDARADGLRIDVSEFPREGRNLPEQVPMDLARGGAGM